MRTRNQRRKPTYKEDTDWRLGTWNCRSFNFDGSDIALASELRPRKFDIIALQELCWQGDKEWYSHRARATFYQSCGTKNQKLGTGFIVMGKMQDRVIGCKHISNRMCKLRIKGRLFNYSIINVHCPHEKRPDDEKEAFYARLEKEYDQGF